MSVIQKSNYKKVKQILWIILFANVGVAVLKIVVGGLINSASLMADGYHSMSDGASNVVGLIGVGIAAKPVDEDHPYGHYKFETLSGLFIAGALFYVAGKIIFDSVPKLSNPSIPNVTIESIVALTMTLIINIFVSYIEYKKGKKLDSYFLISDSMHTRSDIFITVGVLSTLIAVKLGVPPIIDPIVSIGISLIIIKTGYEVLIQAVDVLTDKVTVEPDKIEAVVRTFSEVKGVHKIRSRGTHSHIYIELHILVDPNLNVATTHKLSHDIQSKLRDEIQEQLEANIHIEPINQ